MGRRYRIYASALVVALALGYIGANGFKHFTEFYMTVGQFDAHLSHMVGQPAQVMGQIDGPTVVSRPATDYLGFDLTQGDKRLKVVYHGVKPDTFSGTVQAIVDGRLTRGGVFVANQLLVKCPSRYIAKPVG